MGTPDIEPLTDLRALERRGSPVHLAIGMFDGVHLGHRAVVDAALSGARRDGGRAVVLTFNPHPSRLFKPDDPTLMIQPTAWKRRLLMDLGIDAVVEQVFDRTFAAIEAHAFLPLIFHWVPTLRAVYVGENFRFGKGRRGDIDQLVETGRKIGVHVVSAERIRLDGRPVSSTRIREALEAGRMDEVNSCLGYEYFIEDRVKAGRQLGRTIGFPTVNLSFQPELRPAYGVYAVRVCRLPERAGRGVPGIANFGIRPTVESAGEPLLEVHLLDPAFGSRLQAGDKLEVRWEHFVRPEKRFDDLEALKEQISRDVEQARAFFGLEA
ncbi:MAG: riboflavin biosynthesis protein RibF [Opitutales bacterium]